MLPAYYRFRIKNSTDQTLTYNDGGRLEVGIIPWKMASGAMTQGTVINDTTSLLNAGESIAADAEVEGDVHDNTTNLHIGFTGTFYAISDVTSTDGTLDLYMETSVDNSRWPSDANDFDVEKDCILIAKLNMSTDAADESRACDIQF